MQNTPASHEIPVHAHETRDLSIRGISWFAIGLVISGVFVYFVLAGVWAVLLERRDPGSPLSPYASPKELPPAPRLQVSPPAELKAFRDAEHWQTDTYGWINRPAGTVRLPLDRATELVLERGLPKAIAPEAPKK